MGWKLSCWVVGSELTGHIASTELVMLSVLAKLATITQLYARGHSQHTSTFDVQWMIRGLQVLTACVDNDHDPRGDCQQSRRLLVTVSTCLSFVVRGGWRRGKTSDEEEAGDVGEPVDRGSHRVTASSW